MGPGHSFFTYNLNVGVGGCHTYAHFAHFYSFFFYAFGQVTGNVGVRHTLRVCGNNLYVTLVRGRHTTSKYKKIMIDKTGGVFFTLRVVVGFESTGYVITRYSGVHSNIGRALDQFQGRTISYYQVFNICGHWVHQVVTL